MRRVALLVVAIGASSRVLAHDVPSVQLGVSFPEPSIWRIDVALDPEHLPAAPLSAPAESVRGLSPALEKRFGDFVRAFLRESSLSFDGRRARGRNRGDPCRLGCGRPSAVALGKVEAPQMRVQVFRRFLGLGFSHILPEGGRITSSSSSESSFYRCGGSRC